MPHEPLPHARDAATTDDIGHHSPLPDRYRDGRAVTAILAFELGSQSIRLLRRAEDASEGARALDVYEDEHGYVFRCHPEDGRVVQVDRHEDRHTKARPAQPDARLPVAQLREVAQALAARHVPDFARDTRAFHPFEGNRDRELYLFRWEDCRGAFAESEDPPYVEVGTYADGSLARFTDTLTGATLQEDAHGLSAVDDADALEDDVM
jgi:hypothetical protein